MDILPICMNKMRYILLLYLDISIFFMKPKCELTLLLKGYLLAKNKYGNKQVSWESLIRPSIIMAREGNYRDQTPSRSFKTQIGRYQKRPGNERNLCG